MTDATKISYPKMGRLEHHLRTVRTNIEQTQEHEAETAEGAVGYMNKSLEQIEREIVEIEKIVKEAQNEDN